MLEEIVILRKLIRDESEAIANYADAVSKSDNHQIKQLLRDIMKEEIVHVGELKFLLKDIYGIDDEAEEREGYEEAKEKSEPFQRAKVAYQSIQGMHNQLFQ